jgi:fructose 5-dehydrogenase cytochrome subunit
LRARFDVKKNAMTSVSTLFGLVAAVTLGWGATRAHAASNDADQASLQRGQYLAVASDCIACHTAKDHGKPYAGGYRFDTPMGTIVSSNITPSTTHGIGNYSEEDFARAVREGRRPDGSHLYPAMPYTEYALMTDDDVKALYSYFMHGVAAVDEAPSAKTELKFPFGLPGVMPVWNAMFLGHDRFKPDANVSMLVNRGHYLVDGLAHCTTCHTGRNSMMALDSSAYLGGAVVGGWYAPNITSDKVSGIGGWTDAQLAAYLRTGHVRGLAQAGGGMAEAVENSFRKLDDGDIDAIVAYLHTVKPIRDAGETSPSYMLDPKRDVSWSDFEKPIADNDSAERFASTESNGAALYSAACAACHGVQGHGTDDSTFPPLTRNSAVGALLPNNVVMAIAEGVHRHGADGEVSMPAFSEQSERITDTLTDDQIADVTNYVTEQFGRGNAHLTGADVTAIRAGGRPSFMVRNASTLAIAGIAAAVVIVLLGTLRIRRRRSSAGA